MNEKEYLTYVDGFLKQHNLHAEDIRFREEGVMGILIEGDWKHEHIRLDKLVSEKLGYELMNKEVVSSDGTDYYEAIHWYKVSSFKVGSRIMQSPYSVEYYIDAQQMIDLAKRMGWFFQPFNDSAKRVLMLCQESEVVDGDLVDYVYTMAYIIYTQCFDGNLRLKYGNKDVDTVMKNIMKEIFDNCVMSSI